MAASFSSQTGMNSPERAHLAVTSWSSAVSGGSDLLSDVPHKLTDEQREAAILKAGELIQKYMAQYEETGCFAAHADAERALRLQTLLIKGRSLEVVLRLERERGLA